ncbi:class I SAM-dependent methyltransferase [Marinicella rhabdoformis]|uniref:class I SAM-dependent methyltransferase n=1 Tax=Marinicella rhabdoformis TaxID=2580566 RepID=UPI0012AEB21B|nr:class I SAM-dependent methyltransferase [Marinicella rhabdoformis]
MNFTIFKSKNEFVSHYIKSTPKYKVRNAALLSLEKTHAGRSFVVPGYSITANQSVDFIVDWEYANGEKINWRERLICPKTLLNNRTRLSFHVLVRHLKLGQSERIYITEQLTPFYKYLKKKRYQVTGSEYVGADTKPGKKVRKRFKYIQHEDLTQLSFKGKSMDLVLSFDCLEHIPDYKSAMKEMFRVLKPGGKLLMSFPFDANRHKHLVRAVINDKNEVEHLEPPEYHGDPINDKGCLSFYDFGWNILDEMSEIGFEQPYVITAWSEKYGYLGEEQLLFVASKPL